MCASLTPPLAVGFIILISSSFISRVIVMICWGSFQFVETVAYNRQRAVKGVGGRPPRGTRHLSD